MRNYRLRQIGWIWMLLGAAQAWGQTPPAVSLKVAGSATVVFHHATQACEALDIPDAPARAIHVGSGQVQLYVTHFINRRMVGPDLLHLHQDCRVVYRGQERDDPSVFDDRSWIASLSTNGGSTIHAILHNEFQGHRRPWLCPTGRYMDCWYNALVAATSTDGGSSFHRAAGADALVAALPTPFAATLGEHVGYFNPTGPVELGGATYMMAFATRALTQTEGNCLLRTTNVADPAAWRAWDGVDFGATFIDPYAAPRPGAHVCAPVGVGRLRWPVTSLVRRGETGAFIALMMDGSRKGGVYYATSPDLLAWSEPALLLAGEGEGQWVCGDPSPVAYPSLLDPSSPSADFRTVGASAMLFMTRFGIGECRTSMDRDLIRVPVTLSP